MIRRTVASESGTRRLGSSFVGAGLVCSRSQRPNSATFARRDLGDAKPLVQRRALEDVALDLSPVFLAGTLADRELAVALIGVDPCRDVGVQRLARLLVELAALNVGVPRGLRATRLVERAEELPPLLALDAVAEPVASL